MKNVKLLSSIVIIAVVAAVVIYVVQPGGELFEAKQEVVPDFGALIPERAVDGAEVMPRIEFERVSTAVPWPRGMVWVDGEVVVLARGRHRRAGGVDPNIDDQAGTLFALDPSISEPVVPGELASEAVQKNARVVAKPTSPPFYLYDRDKSALANSLMDRPYCTLIYDAESKNYFICGFSGVDQKGGSFRKNTTDSIHRYDMRNQRWHAVEMHNANLVPEGDLDYVVSNNYYPHHDPEKHGPPHGWLNGADGGCVVGAYLYVVAKDNHRVVQYDLSGVRADPDAGAPTSRAVITEDVKLSYPGGEGNFQALGPSAALARDGWLYVSYRTSSIVIRFRLDEKGQLVDSSRAELIAVFEPWDKAKKRSANVIDLAFNSRGELFVSCAKEGRIWRVGVPDPSMPFYGNDQTDRPTSTPAYVDLRTVTGKEKIGCGNIMFDDQDRMYLCSGTNDTGSPTLKGVIYRVVEVKP